ncbi:MAG: aminotransferase class III-fold pyridoxal phosphate-dependent enzyme [Geminicoccaceae bacterium]|nr:MAG: aminotransferase class III-fold pyridoxal phosphate-dependent enzyme [Geminicoccaceae bacterium]
MTFNPNSAAARDIAYLVHPYTNLRAHESKGPHVITGGEGIYVTDDDGKRFIEGMAGLWCTGLGFSEGRLAKAAAEQMAKMPYMHIFAHRSTNPIIDLAEKLSELAPGKMSKVWFVNSGSEAIDSALKLIWYYQNARGKPEKKIVISRKRAYHGITLAGGHLTALAYARTGFDLPMADRFRQVTTPSHYRDGLPGESEEDFATRLAKELDDLIVAEGPENVAAFFAEPVMGAGGVIVPPKTYFPKIQAVLKKHDVLFVADEVICGFGRTGNVWGSVTYGIQPDLLTCAKQLTSAYIPMGAVLMADHVYDVLADRSHELGTLGMGYTYSGHPVAAAVALETLRIYEDDGIYQHVRDVAPRFQARLQALADEPLVGEARGVGLIGALEIVADKATRAQYPAEAKIAVKVTEALLEEGLILRPLPGDVIGICPPMIITEAEIDDLFDRLRRGFARANAALKTAA